MINIVGHFYETPSGRIVTQEALPVVKFITKQEFDKAQTGMNAKYVVCHGVRNLIDNQIVVVYYIKRR